MRIIATPLLLTSLLVAAACGGKAKPADNPGDPAADGEVATDDEGAADDSGMYPPEKLEEIKSLLDRKRSAAARCLADAVAEGEAAKRARGRVNLAFVIGTNGKARDVKVVESTIKNDAVERCVIEKVEQIDFGAVPSDLAYSYSYAFESN